MLILSGLLFTAVVPRLVAGTAAVLVIAFGVLVIALGVLVIALGMLSWNRDVVILKPTAA